jgi:hypothetical protein
LIERVDDKTAGAVEIVDGATAGATEEVEEEPVVKGGPKSLKGDLF